MGMIALVAGFDSLSWHEAVKPCFLIVLFIIKAFCIKGHCPKRGAHSPFGT